MSAANEDAITLDELGRLIRILGMLGSAHDGEALNAARAAVRWVAEKGTSWEVLLTPPADAGVVAVVAPPDPDVLEAAHAADRAQAYRNGYQAGLADMAQQVKAQANLGQGYGNPWMGSATASPGAAQGAQSPVHGAQAPAGAGQGLGAAAAPGAPGASGGGNWASGTWQHAAQTLLDRHTAGIPGVLRSREEVFVGDILRRGFPTLTQAQEDWLRAIAGRSGLSW